MLSLKCSIDASTGNLLLDHFRGSTKTMTPHARTTKISESILEELWFGEDDASAITAQAAASFAAALADLEGLRPFSEVARRVLEQVADKDFEVGRLQVIIEQDPALATKVLRLANSAAFRPREACVSIKQAIMVLGSRTLSEVAMSLSMMAMFSDVSGIGRTVRDHCASTGALVRALALHRANAGSNSYIVGLLHDFGKLLLLQAQPATYLKIHGNQMADADTIHLREREVLGFDHAVLGAHILRKWGLPIRCPRSWPGTTNPCVPSRQVARWRCRSLWFAWRKGLTVCWVRNHYPAPSKPSTSRPCPNASTLASGPATWKRSGTSCAT